ncbi:hypothetical protein [Billgrantia kenyensis]|uniref:4-alpha-L-fucosyltransferase glycosyl transferase group 56 n=1 Tax=Billgrantia kenyensis TaxID=321266 RepID=A0A7V9W538_9GAMM|nr:hypothetical protein [Halomonas kenyensis]MBA2781160.1 hypothetical protein [Halomonas kenyensis]MCG6663844.1 hypothetical protein [Halomonas kenyensis]
MQNIHVMPNHFFTEYFINKIYTIGAGDNNFFIIKEPGRHGVGIDSDAIKTTCSGNYLFYSCGQLWGCLSKFITSPNAVYFHGLDNESEHCVIKIKKISSVKVGWIYWGEYILHSRYKERDFFYSELTRKYVQEQEWGRANLIKKLMLATGIFYLRELLNSNVRMFFRTRAIKHVDYFLHWNAYDFLSVMELHGFTENKPAYKKFSYGEYLEKGSTNFRCSQPDNSTSSNDLNVMLGHSANLSVNHLDGLEALRKAFSMLDNKLIINVHCVLSYGDEEYRKKVINDGRLILGEYFKPITKRMPLSDYHAFLGMIDAAVFPIRHSAAGGNIAKLLSYGTAIFIDERSTLFSHFTDMGFDVYPLSAISHDFYNVILRHDKMNNIMRFKEVFTIDAIEQSYKHFAS